MTGFTVGLGSSTTEVSTAALSSADTERLMQEYEALGYTVQVER